MEVVEIENGRDREIERDQDPEIGRREVDRGTEAGGIETEAKTENRINPKKSKDCGTAIELSQLSRVQYM